MKSLEELYSEVKKNEELKKAFVSAYKEGRVEEFLKAHECDASVSDVNDFLSNTKIEELSDDDLEKVAGGGCSSLSCNDTCGCYTIAYPYCG